MRHHGRADDADRDIEHGRVGDDARLRDEAAQDLAQHRLGENELGHEAAGDHQQQSDDEGFEVACPILQQAQDHQGADRSDGDAPAERNAEQQLQGDRGAQQLRQVAGDDGELAQRPQRDGDPRREMLAAQLREVAPGGDAELGAEILQQHGHHAGQQHDRQQRIAEGRSAGEVGRPVARIHVADRHQVARPAERQQFPPETGQRRLAAVTVEREADRLIRWWSRYPSWRWPFHLPWSILRIVRN